MMESRSAYGYYGVAGGFTGERRPSGNPVRLPYREYKQRWADHKTVPGSYDKQERTIEVIFDNEEMKAKTNLGNRYHLESFYFRFDGVQRGISPVVDFQAKTRENAIRNARKYARDLGYTFVGEVDYREYNRACGR